MVPKFSTSPDFDFELALEGGGALTRQTAALLPQGAYRFEDALDVPGTVGTTVITCTAWLLELYQLDAGEMEFRRGTTSVRAVPGRVGVFYPPLALVQLTLRGARGRMVGVAGTAPLPPLPCAGPVLFDTDFGGLPGGVDEVAAIVRAGRAPRPIDAFPEAGPLARAAKRLIDENYEVYPAIGRVAARLGVTHAHLSRQFKREYEMSPSAYLHQLRLADTPLRLARGEPIVEVSLAAGYNDLSRFYQQFRRRTHTSPGACQALVQPD